MNIKYINSNYHYRNVAHTHTYIRMYGESAFVYLNLNILCTFRSLAQIILIWLEIVASIYENTHIHICINIFRATCCLTLCVHELSIDIYIRTNYIHKNLLLHDEQYIKFIVKLISSHLTTQYKQTSNDRIYMHIDIYIIFII